MTDQEREIIAELEKELIASGHVRETTWRGLRVRVMLLDAVVRVLISDRVKLRAYEEVLADHRRVVRELDVLMNGEEGAAKQAALIDLFSQIKGWRKERRELAQAIKRLEDSYGVKQSKKILRAIAKANSILAEKEQKGSGT